jgi:hypothetical protein
MRLWTNETGREYKGKQRWAKLAVKRDEARVQDYFDVLVGKVGQEWHAHLGIGLDQSILFQEDRGLIHKIGRRIESLQNGLIEDRNLMVSSDVPAEADLILKFDVNRRTGEITVLEFGLAE